MLQLIGSKTKYGKVRDKICLYSFAFFQRFETEKSNEIK